MNTEDYLRNKFSNECGWGAPIKGHGRVIFDFLYKAACACTDDMIVLDISAGQSRYKPFFEHAQYLAIDLSIPENKWDYSKLDIIGDALQLPIKGDAIDVCLNFTSLEHYAEPMRAFHEFNRVLKPDGKLFLYVPSVHCEHQLPHDYFRYTHNGLKYLAETNNFIVEHLVPTNSMFETAMDVMREAIKYLPISNNDNQNIKDNLKEVMKTLITPFFEAAEESCNEYAKHHDLTKFLPPWPLAYCLQARKEGKRVPTSTYSNKRELIKDIAGCPVCKSPLKFKPDAIACEGCGKKYVYQNGIPALVC